MKTDASIKAPASAPALSSPHLSSGLVSAPTLAQNAVASPASRVDAAFESMNPIDSIESRGSLHRAYHEIANGHHVVETGALEQLRANIAQLEDLHGRLKFLMAEISGLVKRG